MMDHLRRIVATEAGHRAYRQTDFGLETAVERRQNY